MKYEKSLIAQSLHSSGGANDMLKFGVALASAVVFSYSPFATAAPVISASTEQQLVPAIAWGEDIAKNSVAAQAGDRKALEAVVSSLYAWASVDAMLNLSGTARGIYPRRISGPIMAWRAIRRQAPNDPRSKVIDRWAYKSGLQLRKLFGLGAGASGVVLNYNNNLQATAAMTAYASGLIVQDSSLRWWAIASAKEVLNEVDQQGFTNEIYRSNNEKAEYYSHETMIYLIELAQMASKIGNDDLWSWTGRKALLSRDPAMLRAGRLLDKDLGTSILYSLKTGKRQISYPSPIYSGKLLVPSGYLGCWMDGFLAHYAGSFSHLRAAKSAYAVLPRSQFNAGIGGYAL